MSDKANHRWKENRKRAIKSLSHAKQIAEGIKKDVIDDAQQIRKSVGSHQQGNALADKLIDINACIATCGRYLEDALTNSVNIPPNPPESPKATK